MNRLHQCTRELSDSLSAFVLRYGIAEAIALEDVSAEIVIGDFFQYCMAKGSKHIRAALVLLDNGFPEDAIVLSRSAYECYVNAAYAQTKGVQAIDDLVYNTVGLNAQTVEYAQKKTGGRDYRRLIDKNSGILYDAPPSIEKMIRSTGYPADLLVHRDFYRYSSEHAHVNMAGSGNYRDGASYTDRRVSLQPNAEILVSYVTSILASIAITATQVDVDERSRIRGEIRALTRQLNKVLTHNFNNSDEDLVRGIQARLEQASQ